MTQLDKKNKGCSDPQSPRSAMPLGSSKNLGGSLSFEEEILTDAEENKREIAFIREQLPVELKEKYTDEQLSFMIDAICTYIYTSGVLESNSDEVDIDMEAASNFVCNEAKEEGEGPFDPEEVFFVVEADLDFQEQNV